MHLIKRQKLYTDHRVLEGWIHLAGCYRRKETDFHLFPQLAFVVIDRQMVNFRMDLGFGQDWENLRIETHIGILVKQCIWWKKRLGITNILK